MKIDIIATPFISIVTIAKKIDIFIAEEPADTTEESSPAVEEEGQNVKDSTAGPETTATTTTTTTTPACEPTDHWKISTLIVGWNF